MANPQYIEESGGAARVQPESWLLLFVHRTAAGIFDILSIQGRFTGEAEFTNESERDMQHGIWVRGILCFDSRRGILDSLKSAKSEI